VGLKPLFVDDRSLNVELFQTNPRGVEAGMGF